MSLEPSYLALGANGLVTVGCSIYLCYYFLRKVRNRTFLLWFLGLLLFGVQILLRLELPIDTPIVVLLFLSSYTMIIMGTAQLVQRLKLSGLVLAVFIPSSLVVGYIFQNPSAAVGLSVLVLYGYMSVLAFMLKRRYGSMADLFVIGWFLLLFSNILFILSHETTYVNILAALSKVILTFGMVQHRFARLVLEITKTFQSGG